MKINARFFDGIFIITGILVMVLLLAMAAQADVLSSVPETAYVYPNPALTSKPMTLRIETGQKGPLQAKIFDVTGSLIVLKDIPPPQKSDSHLASRHDISLSAEQFRPGTYFGVLTGSGDSDDDFKKNFWFSVVK